VVGDVSGSGDAARQSGFIAVAKSFVLNTLFKVTNAPGVFPQNQTEPESVEFLLVGGGG
jgi:hypothetical protein